MTTPLLRRRPMLRIAAIGGGAYYLARTHREAKDRENAEQARIERGALRGDELAKRGCRPTD